jgi:fucose permease
MVIQRDYSIGYAVVSIIFVAQAIGFICAAFFISSITNKFGRSNALILAALLLLGSYGTIIVKPPFPVVALA